MTVKNAVKAKGWGKRIIPQTELVSLPLWTEIIGIFNGFSSDNAMIYVKIDNKILCLPKDSIESEAALGELNIGLIGHRIGLLRTDEPVKPLAVRLIDK